MEVQHIHQHIWEAIQGAQSIVITSHVSPDGDSIGSSLALYHFLQSIGKSVHVCHADAAPSSIAWLKGASDIRTFEKNSSELKAILEAADLIFCLDYNDPTRVGSEIAEIMAHHSALKVMIDHHLNPGDFCALTYSDTSASSTAQMIYELIVGSGQRSHLNVETATAIYLGIMTDTGSFRFPSVHARTHEIIADLLHTGIKHHEIHEKVYDVNSISQLQLKSYAISEKMELLPNFPVAIVALTKDELEKYKYKRGDLDGLVNVPLSIQGIAISVLFMETEDKIKISFRAKGDFAVNVLAKEHFGGGGHRYASGGVSFDALPHTLEKFKSLIPAFFG
jgi:phosphoesterase RecJ-like protein